MLRMFVVSVEVGGYIEKYRDMSPISIIPVSYRINALDIGFIDISISCG